MKPLSFRKPPWETKIGSKNRIVHEIEGEITVLNCGKRLLVRVIEKFEKVAVREIGTPKAVVIDILIPHDHDQQLGKIRNS